MTPTAAIELLNIAFDEGLPRDEALPLVEEYCNDAGWTYREPSALEWAASRYGLPESAMACLGCGRDLPEKTLATITTDGHVVLDCPTCGEVRWLDPELAL